MMGMQLNVHLLTGSSGATVVCSCVPVWLQHVCRCHMFNILLSLFAHIYARPHVNGNDLLGCIQSHCCSTTATTFVMVSHLCHIIQFRANASTATHGVHVLGSTACPLAAHMPGATERRAMCEVAQRYMRPRTGIEDSMHAHTPCQRKLVFPSTHRNTRSHAITCHWCKTTIPQQTLGRESEQKTVPPLRSSVCFSEHTHQLAGGDHTC
jgi:hypothetical protein